jgi:hypothetical protein
MDLLRKIVVTKGKLLIIENDDASLMREALLIVLS